MIADFQPLLSGLVCRMSLWCVFTQRIHTASQLLRGPAATDIGGGSVDNDTAYALARIPAQVDGAGMLQGQNWHHVRHRRLAWYRDRPPFHLPHRTAASPAALRG